MKKHVLFLATLFVLALIPLYLIYRPVHVPPSGIVYYLKPGESKAQLVDDLTQLQILPNPHLFLFYAELHASTGLKTGEYFIAPGTSVRGLWKQLTIGTGHYYRAFTIVPGWTFAQLRQALMETPFLRHTSTLMDNDNLMALMTGQPISPEGQFLPETYYYLRDDVDVSVLKRANKMLQDVLNSAWEKRDTSVPYTDAYQALTAASLVEREAYLAAERPVIAGVLVNRLNKHMLLQFDPTVIFGMGTQYQGKITKVDLQTDTPYNTYIHTGLPPTPIAMSSASTINAALHPLHHDYYYFVAKGDGSHQFSKTLTEHNAAVQAAILRGKSSALNNPIIQKEVQNLLTGKLSILVSPIHHYL